MIIRGTCISTLPSQLHSQHILTTHNLQIHWRMYKQVTPPRVMMIHFWKLRFLKLQIFETLSALDLHSLSSWFRYSACFALETYGSPLIGVIVSEYRDIYRHL
jgi:hypothetical protein